MGQEINPGYAILPPDLAYKPANQELERVDPSGFKEEQPDPSKQGLLRTDLLRKDAGPIQILIKSIGGKHFCMQLSKGMSIHALKKEIQSYLGTPTQHQNLIYSGYSLQDNQTLQHYGIAKDSTIILNLRLRGGSTGTSSKNASSFRDAVRGGEKTKNKAAPPSKLPGPYIVE